MQITDAQIHLLQKLLPPPPFKLLGSRAIYVDAEGRTHFHTLDGPECGPDAFLLLCSGALSVGRRFPDFYVLTLSRKGHALAMEGRS